MEEDTGSTGNAIRKTKKTHDGSGRQASEKLWFLPVFTVVWIVLWCFLTYIISVSSGHVKPDLPYVSDTGALLPESSAFTFGFAFAAVLVSVIIWLKYEHARLQYGSDCSRAMKRCNSVSHVMGQISAAGFVVIACVPESVSLWVHLIGAVMCLGGGLLYGCVQTYHTSLAARASLGPSKCLAVFRMALSTIGFISLAVGGILALIRVLLTKDWTVPVTVTRYTSPWRLHVSSSSCEWIAGISYLLFLLTFSHEFWELSLTLPQVSLREKKHGTDKDPYKIVSTHL